MVDDNSSSVEIDTLKEIASERKIRPIYTKESRGAGHARNIGLTKAEGEWILFLDADDFFSENAFNVLDDYSSASEDVVFLNFNTINASDGSVWNVMSDFKLLFTKQELSQDDIDILRFKLTPPWSKMVRKSFIDRHCIFFEEVPQGNDVFYSFQVGYWGTSFKIESTPIYNYTRNTEGITRKKWKAKTAIIYLKRHKQFCNFYKFIDRPDWKSNFVKRSITTIRHSGIFAGLLAIVAYPFDNIEQVDYVKSIKTRL